MPPCVSIATPVHTCVASQCQYLVAQGPHLVHEACMPHPSAELWKQRQNQSHTCYILHQHIWPGCASSHTLLPRVSLQRLWRACLHTGHSPSNTYTCYFSEPPCGGTGMPVCTPPVCPSTAMCCLGMPVIIPEIHLRIKYWLCFHAGSQVSCEP